LSEISEFGNDLSDRAKEWDQATDEIRRDSAQLESYRNQLSSDLEAAANSAKAKAENAKKVSEAIPATEEKSNDKPDTEENTESSVKQPLLTGPELVNRLMKMVKRKS
jgi:seryl-tRNA synthetase